MKKVHINESGFKRNFNEDVEPMSSLEKILKGIEEYPKADIDPSILDDDGLGDDDDRYAKMFIAARLADAQDALLELSDYLENSDYAIERGGDLFKRYLEKATNIYNEIGRFWDEN